MLFCAVASVTAFPAAAQTLSAGTYNVRQLNAGDDARGDGWQQRLPVIASLIRFHDFDIFGAQEVFHSQLEDLLGALPGYGYTGVGRDDGAEAGEYSVVFYKRDRFELLDSGHFWLAEDPSRPNRGWAQCCILPCSPPGWTFPAAGWWPPTAVRWMPRPCAASWGSLPSAICCKTGCLR